MGRVLSGRSAGRGIAPVTRPDHSAPPPPPATAAVTSPARAPLSGPQVHPAPPEGPGSAARVGGRELAGRPGQLHGEGRVGSVCPGNENQPPGNECSSSGLLRLENTCRRRAGDMKATAGGEGRDRQAPAPTPGWVSGPSGRGPNHRGRGAEEPGIPQPLPRHDQLMGSACPTPPETPALGVTMALGFGTTPGAGARPCPTIPLLSPPSFFLCSRPKRFPQTPDKARKTSCGCWRFAASCGPQIAGLDAPDCSTAVSTCTLPRRTAPRLPVSCQRPGLGGERQPAGHPGLCGHMRAVTESPCVHAGHQLETIAVPTLRTRRPRPRGGATLPCSWPGPEWVLLDARSDATQGRAAVSTSTSLMDDEL